MTIPRTVLAFGLCLMLCGCGTKHSDRPAVHPVGGKLLVAGKPAANAEVILYPVAGAEKLDPPRCVRTPWSKRTVPTT